MPDRKPVASRRPDATVGRDGRLTRTPAERTCPVRGEPGRPPTVLDDDVISATLSTALRNGDDFAEVFA